MVSLISHAMKSCPLAVSLKIKTLMTVLKGLFYIVVDVNPLHGFIH